jgi:hypothetical protein
MPGVPPVTATPVVASRAALRRLTEAELRATMTDLLGADPGVDLQVWPEDARTPFDNDYTTQFGSRALVEAAKSIADRAAVRLVSDATARQQVVGCVPAGPSDTACLRQFIGRFGRQALRRPLEPSEVDRYAGFISHNTSSGDFYTAVGMVVRALLQDMEFLYRVEVGTPVTGQANLLKLNGFEVGARLSYLLWGSGPDNQLLDTAAAGTLGTPTGVRTAALRLLGDQRARKTVDRFHALWLGYEQARLPAALNDDMQAESNALIERVVFDDKAPWLDLLRRKETFINATLAKHYGLPSPGTTAAKWVPYGASGRQGLLSHGTFLSVASTFSDTSPTRRGKMIRERLLCTEIPLPPPELEANTDEPPTRGGICKYDRYAVHREGGCAGCHSLLDPVGFGLENYDSQGRYRTTQYWMKDPADPTGDAVLQVSSSTAGATRCDITGQGELVGVGTFRGPAELSERLLEAGELDRCAVTQLFKFASGREKLDADDARVVDLLTGKFRDKQHRFDELLLEYVSRPAFGYRIVE